MDHTPSRQLLIELTEAHLTKEEISAAFTEGASRQVDLTTDLSLKLRGLGSGMIEIALSENNNQPRAEVFLKMHFGIF